MIRRHLLGLLAGAPLVGKAAVEEAFRGGASSGLAGAINRLKPYAETGSAGASCAQQVANPLIDHATAMRLIFGDAAVLAEIREELAEENRYVASIDPDLAVMRCFSPMAKVTFQRQRNIDRALAEAMDERNDRPRRYIRAIDKHLVRLMWGKSLS